MGWLFGNKDNSRTETKTVNDNGKLKELQLTITGPDSTMVVTGDEYRTTVPLRGTRPVAAEEVLIERKAPNGMWLNSLIPFYDGDVKGTQKKARSLWQLPAVEGQSQGSRMNKFQNGGSTQPTQDQVMKELMAIVQQAATELQSNKPGQGVQTLAQIANDPQGSQLLDALVQQVPEAGQIVEAVMKMVGAFKCGGKTKKKVKKGAKGCIPCKKLMRVGGKLINIWSDCEGNIISKHQVGGWLIPKGSMGLVTNKLLNAKYRTAMTPETAGSNGQKHYYMDDTGKWYGQHWVTNEDGTGGWQNIDEDQNALREAALAWARGNKSAEGQFENPVNDFFVNGFTWDYDKGTGAFLGDDREALARTTLGDQLYNESTVLGKEIRGVKGRSQNNWTSADPVEALDPTADDYIDQFGVLGAFRRERDRFRDGLRTIRQEKRAAVQGARDTRKDNSAENDVLGSTVRNTWRNTALAGMRQNRADQMAALIDATFNKWGTYYGNRAYKAGSGRVYNTPEGFDNRVIANANSNNAGNNNFDSRVIANAGSNDRQSSSLDNGGPDIQLMRENDSNFINEVMGDHPALQSLSLNQNGVDQISIGKGYNNYTPSRRELNRKKRLAKKEKKWLDQELPSNVGEDSNVSVVFNYKFPNEDGPAVVSDGAVSNSTLRRRDIRRQNRLAKNAKDEKGPTLSPAALEMINPKMHKQISTIVKNKVTPLDVSDLTAMKELTKFQDGGKAAFNRAKK